MLFNSYEFVFCFLPLVMVLWWIAPWPLTWRLGALVTASYLFYGWWDYRFVALLAISTLVDYGAGAMLYRATSPRQRSAALMLSLFSNLGMLAFFKYSGFFARSVNAIAAAIHAGEPFPIWEVILPVGISFYTFQTMSYTIDLYRRQAAPANSLLHFAAYVSMFPQLIAGPIVRYGDMEQQLRSVRTRVDWTMMASGIYFFACGLGQKLLLADLIAHRIDPMLTNYASLGFVGSWTAMLGYSCQLYFDFSGYSNMAVGLGMMLGFHFPQNFDSPYQSPSIAQFWRRWHMTLSSWLRDYLFVPLGGSRGTRWMALRNLTIVMFLGGLWHGAGWTFVVWGIYHGGLLVAHRIYLDFRMPALPRPVATLVTFLLVVVGWVFFRSESMQMAGVLLAAMSGARGLESEMLAAAGGVGTCGLLIVLLAGTLFLPNLWQYRFRPSLPWAVAISAMLFVCVLRFDSVSPFLYFQF